MRSSQRACVCIPALRTESNLIHARPARARSLRYICDSASILLQSSFVHPLPVFCRASSARPYLMLSAHPQTAASWMKHQAVSRSFTSLRRRSREDSVAAFHAERFEKRDDYAAVSQN